MLWRRRKSGDFESEIEAHLQLEAERFQEQGLSREDALMAARRSFGNVARAEERFYESGRWMPWDHFSRDIRFATRVLAKDARFSIMAVLGLALGIGVSTAIFALINLSIRAESDRGGNDPSYVGLIRLVRGHPGFSYSQYRYLQDHATSLREVIASSGWERFILGPLSAGAEAEEVQGRFVSGNFLSAGGLHPAIGRSFTQAEEQSGSPAVVVLDYSYWMQCFGSDPSVLGKDVVLNAHHLTIVGVADEHFVIGNTSQLYLPLALQPILLQEGDWLRDTKQDWLMLEAWLQSVVTVRQSQAEIDVLARALNPSGSGDTRILVSSDGPNPTKKREMLATVAAVTIAVSAILLIACSNLANLLLARAVVRRREIGVRLSLGASRLRLVSQLLTESMLLALAGGFLGILLSQWLAKSMLLRITEPNGLIRLFHLDTRVLLYSFVLSLATGLSFGLAPALAATKTNLSQALHSASLSGGGSSHRLWAGRNLLVIVPLAVSLMLLLAAGVAVRRVQSSYRKGLPFDPSRLIGASLRLNVQGYDEPRTRQFQDNLRQRIAAMPGVASVAMATILPLSNGRVYPIVVDGASIPENLEPHADYNIISPGYFETIGVAVTRGRGLAASDREGSPPVALVNQELARRYWPGEESIGKRIRLAGSGTVCEIVGVAPDLEDAGGRDNYIRPTIYVPYAQGKLFLGGIHTDPPPYQMQFLIRTNGTASAVKSALHQEIFKTDASLRVQSQTIQESLEERVGPLRTISLLLSALGSLALIMAAVGIYAILAYAVSQRTREIGIRAALGAQRSEILALVMQRTMMLIFAGIGAGLFGAFLVTRAFARALGQFGELDAPTCVAVSLILAAVAMLASYLPARKALRVDPAQALRCE